MNRLASVLGISSLLTLFWFCSGYILSLLLGWSINFAFVMSALAFIISFGALSLFGSDPWEKYRGRN